MTDTDALPTRRDHNALTLWPNYGVNPMATRLERLHQDDGHKPRGVHPGPDARHGRAHVANCDFSPVNSRGGEALSVPGDASQS